MTRIEEIIPELLAQHDCVVIPSFGGFIAKVNPATVDFERGIMLPPYRSVLFNRSLRSDDGLLTHHLSKLLENTYAEAATLISDKVKEWNAALNEGKRLEIERLGKFHKTSDGMISFEQDRHFNLLLSSYGLDTVRFTQVHESPVVEEVDVKIEPTQSRNATAAIIADLEEQKETEPALRVVKRRRPLVRYAAAAVLLPIAFYSFWIPAKTDVLQSGVVSLKDFNPFYKKHKGTYLAEKITAPTLPSSKTKEDLDEQINNLPAELSVYSYRFTADKFIPVQLKEKESSALTDVRDFDLQPGAMNYIVGCFASKENADNLVEKLKASGLGAHIVDQHNGLHRVSAGSALSEEALSEIGTQAESLGFKGWILK